MIAQTTRYGIGITVPLPYERAVERTKEALAAEGFGVLTEIDVAVYIPCVCCWCESMPDASERAFPAFPRVVAE